MTHSRPLSSTVAASASCLDVAAGHELKMRPWRASSGDLQVLANGRAGEDWELMERSKRAACGGGGSGNGSARHSPRSTPPLKRRNLRCMLSTALSLALFLVLLFKHRSLYRNGQDAFAQAYYGLDPSMLGRSEAWHPAPHCCRDEGCATPRRTDNTTSSFSSGGSDGSGRVAVVTYLRDDAYMPLLQQLECTLRRTNPGLELGLMMVEGELGTATLALAHDLNITLLPVQPLQYRNTYDDRYSNNWLKVRALGLTQYDSVLLVDADVAVAGPLGPLFSMPVEFAAVWDQSKWLNRYRTAVTSINGGVFLLRPCAAAEAHMLSLLEAHPKLRFTHGTAEQDFFGWYYKYTGATLPLQYNAQAEESLGADGLTVGGIMPKIVHFTVNKPFHGPQSGALGHRYLCSIDELHRRSIPAGQMALSDAATVEAAASGIAGSKLPDEEPEEPQPEQQDAGQPQRTEQQDAGQPQRTEQQDAGQPQRTEQQQQGVEVNPVVQERQGRAALEPDAGAPRPDAAQSSERATFWQQGQKQLP